MVTLMWRNGENQGFNSSVEPTSFIRAAKGNRQALNLNAIFKRYIILKL